MRRLLLWLACVGALCAGAGVLSAIALADGTTTSAGDQQYVDPLTTATRTHTSTRPAATSTTATGTTSTSSTLSQTPPSGVPSSTSSASSSSSSAPAAGASAHTLPYTGLDLGACLAVALGLLGSGLALRRIALSWR